MVIFEDAQACNKIKYLLMTNKDLCQNRTSRNFPSGTEGHVYRLR